MIIVDYIFRRVNNTLSRKNQNGYSSTEDFNGDLRDSENILFEFYHKDYDSTQKISDALYPFIEEKPLLISSGLVSYPDDYRHALEMSYRMVISSENCDKPKVKEVPMDKLSVNEERDILESFIRKPSLEKELLYWTQLGKNIRVRPLDLIGDVTFKYLRNPNFGLYSTKVDTVRQMDVYDPSTSKNLEWNEQETVNLVDLMLFHKGIEIKDSEIIQFASNKMQLNSNTRK